MNLPRVFVYGTLLSGEPNHSQLSQATLLEEAWSQARYELVNLGPFPGLTPGGRTAVFGEVYEVDWQLLETLDAFEGHPSFYSRKTIRLSDGVEAESYLLPRHRAEGWPRIPSGDWRARHEEEHR